jgi:hypothetical protein
MYGWLIKSMTSSFSFIPLRAYAKSPAAL